MNVVFRKVARPPKPVIEAFEALDVATAYEAMASDRLMDVSLRPLVPGRAIVGPAVTALNAPGDNLAMHVALALAEPGDVLVTSTGSTAHNALWGEQVTLYAASLPLAGVVTDGAVRDIASFARENVPVWSPVVMPRKSTKAGPVAVNVPIACGGVVVNPGDIMMADDDGVVVIPSAEADEVLAAAQARKDAERERHDALAGGTSPFDLLGMESALARTGARVIDDVYRHNEAVTA